MLSRDEISADKELNYPGKPAESRSQDCADHGFDKYQTSTEDFQMAKRINPQPAISAEEILQAEILVNQALIDILISKQVISEMELVNSIQKIKKEQEKIIEWLS